MITELTPGRRVRIIQQVQRREGDWRMEVVGEVVDATQEKTGSWYAHSKDDKLWLTRVRLRKNDGELTTISVDQHTQVEFL
ncbi:MAG: hypothetical protein HRU75_01020 [Planctomycetia bacterium]|nr:MAG: hypothetical protein HRU75_01020 [Planctomycetia bacterium]